MNRYARRDGVLIEPVGHVWAAYSPATGETSLLNDESASILEILSLGAASTESVCMSLAADTGLAVDALTEIVEACWPRLIEAGLAREQRPDDCVAR